MRANTVLGKTPHRKKLFNSGIARKVGGGCRSNLHGTKVHGARVRAPVGFEYKKGLVHDLSMCIGHTKFNFTLLEPY